MSSVLLNLLDLPTKLVLCMTPYHNILQNSSSVELDFAQEIEKILITDFSVLDLSLEAKGHVYGATLLRLFSVPRVHTGLKLLKVILLRLRKSEVVQSCPGNCQCDSPKNWRSQSISMVHLEEVEIKGLKGEDHDFDVLKLILRCAPSLKRMTVELETGIKSHGHGDCTKEINSISL
uniref:FBD domain-containing protein n=1 Tax=Triticum urartu TaxID=4572 RepID=A0A8R7V3J9_TRIUA